MALFISPAASTKAARQSLKPALVRSRNSFTSLAGISMAAFGVLILSSLFFDPLNFPPQKSEAKLLSIDAAEYWGSIAALLQPRFYKRARSKAPRNGPHFLRVFRPN